MAKDGKCPPWVNRCYRCGKEGHIGSDEACAARNAKCRKCHSVGHYDGVYRTSRRSGGGQQKNPSTVNAVEDADEDEYDFTVGLGTGTSDEASIEVKVERITVKNVLIDSGATCNVINKATRHDLKEQGIASKLTHSTKRLLSCGSAEPLQCMEEFRAHTQLNNREVNADYIVVGSGDQGLLGRQTA